MLYLISYDLNNPEKTYNRLYDEFDRLDAHPVLDSQWIVNLSGTSTRKVLTHFKRFIDSDDMLLVFAIPSPGSRAGFNLPFRWSDL